MIQIPDWLPQRPTLENILGLCVALSFFSGAVEVSLYVFLGVPPLLGPLFMVLAGVTGLITLFRISPRFPVLPPVLIPLAFWSAFAVWAALGAIWSTSPGIVGGKLLLFFGVTLAFLVFGICVGFAAAAFDSFERALFTIGLATAVAVFLFANRDISHFSIDQASQALMTFKDSYQPVTLCISLAAMVALAHVLAGAHGRKRTLAWGAAWLFLTAGMLAGGGRGAAIGGALAQVTVFVFAMFVFRRERGSSRLLGVLLIAPFFGIAALSAGSLLQFRGIERLASIANSTTDKTGRDELWSAALKMADANPVFGAGFGSFQGSANNLQEAGHYPHNVFLELLAENGLIGFTLFLAALVTAVFATTRRAGTIPFTHVAIWLGFLVCTLFQMNVTGTITGREFAFVLGLSVGLTARSSLCGLAQRASPSPTPQSQSPARRSAHTSRA